MLNPPAGYPLLTLKTPGAEYTGSGKNDVSEWPISWYPGRGFFCSHTGESLPLKARRAMATRRSMNPADAYQLGAAGPYIDHHPANRIQSSFTYASRTDLNLHARLGLVQASCPEIVPDLAAHDRLGRAVAGILSRRITEKSPWKGIFERLSRHAETDQDHEFWIASGRRQELDLKHAPSIARGYGVPFTQPFDKPGYWLFKDIVDPVRHNPKYFTSFNSFAEIRRGFTPERANELLLELVEKLEEFALERGCRPMVNPGAPNTLVIGPALAVHSWVEEEARKAYRGSGPRTSRTVTLSPGRCSKGPEWLEECLDKAESAAARGLQRQVRIFIEAADELEIEDASRIAGLLLRAQRIQDRRPSQVAIVISGATQEAVKTSVLAQLDWEAFGLIEFDSGAIEKVED